MRISWYGRCCFLVEFEQKKVLFDPYDLFCNVDLGLIDADVLIISSTWHDHGHIGASPGAWIYSYKGSEENFGMTITGIEALENRGSPTVIFNVRYLDFSITNFADFGRVQSDRFETSLSQHEREVLASTNIAMARPSIVGDEVGEINEYNEIFLRYCQPKIVFPEHYFSRGFIHEHIPKQVQEYQESVNVIVDEMPDALGYELREIDDYKIEITSEQLETENKLFYKFLRIHPQVKYSEINIARSW